MRVLQVWRLVRRVTRESVILAFVALALWSIFAPVDEGEPYVFRGPLAHVRVLQWYDSTQDSAPDQDEALASARRTDCESTTFPLTPSLCSGAHIVTESDLSAPDQSFFLNPSGPRSPPKSH